MSKNSDWLSRVNLPDLYHRGTDAFRPGSAPTPASAPPGSFGDPDAAGPDDIYRPWVTDPGQRPVVFQKALNFNVNAGVSPVPVIAGTYPCDTIVIDVFSTAANSVFYGFGSSISVSSGIEVRPGLPIAITPDNTREQWELQRMLEILGAILASDRGFNPPGKFRAPRVVFDASNYYLVAPAPTVVSVMLFNIPELQ